MCSTCLLFSCEVICYFWLSNKGLYIKSDFHCLISIEKVLPQIKLAVYELYFMQFSCYICTSLHQINFQVFIFQTNTAVRVEFVSNYCKNAPVLSFQNQKISTTFFSEILRRLLLYYLSLAQDILLSKFMCCADFKSCSDSHEKYNQDVRERERVAGWVGRSNVFML